MTTSGPDELLDRGGELLLAEEARHNLALGILSTARAHPDVYPDVHGWLVVDGGRVVGAALRTPPHNLVLAQPRDERAVEALAEAIDDDLPGVVGAVPEVDAFANAWAARRGLQVRTSVEQRIYALRVVVREPAAEGSFRLAGPVDREGVLGWWTAFAEEVLEPRGSTELEEERRARNVDARLAASPDSGVGLWEVDGRAVSLAGFGGPTPNGIRIGPVYTPPELRGRGYGTAVTTAVSQLLLERGHRFCFLYTDLANPTSNAIYTRIGYEPVCDSHEIAFVTTGR